MPSLLFGQDQAVAAWVAQRIRTVGHEGFGPCAAIGVLDDAGAPIAGVVYYGLSHGALFMAVASENPSWATRATLKALFRYPFAQLGCRRVSAIAEKKAKPTRAFLLRLGFRMEGHMPQQFPHDDAIIYGLLRQDWNRVDGDVIKLARRLRSVDMSKAA